jgi:hypothetical protein
LQSISLKKHQIQPFPLLYWIVTAMFSLLFQCQSKQDGKVDKPTVANSQSLTKNILLPKQQIVHPSIACHSAGQYSYALYLPSSFDGQKKHAVAFVFDPHGNGQLPLQNYKQLAEKYQYILVGVNSCRNGLPWDTINAIAQATMNEILEKYPVDNRRIYTIGFSGGARVASALAIANPAITGLTAVGAGFQNSTANLTYNFDFFGMAAHGDFNMTELVSLDQMLSTTAMPHYIHLYDGTHEWSTAIEMDYAFLWHEIQAMKSKKIKKNDSLVTQFIKTELSQIAQGKKQKNVMQEYNALSRLVKFANGVQDITLYQQQLTILAASKAILTMQKNRKQQQVIELQLTKSYWKSLHEKNLDWWRKEIAKLKAKKYPPNTTNTQLNQRLVGFLGLATYMQATTAVANVEVANAEKLLQIYQWLEPKNPEQPYLKASLESALGNSQQALALLESAQKLGFADTNRLLADVHFMPLKSEQRFQKMLKNIRDK